ncbi:hypothetical protein AX16_004712 [Volvariella volvacea WC 439]|nr:hypothetical protein AX16_004712 [Volvariella volvacea WC 439]
MSGVGKNPERVQAGLKATVHNPRVSEEARESATQRLNEMGTDVESKHSSGHNYAKTTAERAREAGVVNDVDEEFDAADYTGQSAPSGTAAGRPKNEGNVIGGYKATLKNPNVSEEARQHAEQVLEEKGAK